MLEVININIVGSNSNKKVAKLARAINYFNSINLGRDFSLFVLPLDACDSNWGPNWGNCFFCTSTAWKLCVHLLIFFWNLRNLPLSTADSTVLMMENHFFLALYSYTVEKLVRKTFLLHIFINVLNLVF